MTLSSHWHLKPACLPFHQSRVILNMYMLSFAEFLSEQFVKGHKTDAGYAEIFVNPGPSELAEIGNNRNYTELGGLVHGSKLYVWNRENAMHNEVRSALKIPASAMPLYLFFNLGARSIRARIANYSAPAKYLYMSPADVRAILSKHPAFNGYRLEDDDYGF